MICPHALRHLKTKLGIRDDDKDLLLDLLLDEAQADILAYTRRSESQWLPIFDAVQVQIAVEAYGRLGVEGVQSRSEGGVTTTFVENGAIKALAGYRLIKGV